MIERMTDTTKANDVGMPDDEQARRSSHCYREPEIAHGDRRPIDEIWPESICGCGRKVRYISCDGDTSKDACNKYGRCISWDELKAKYDELREAAQEFADEPMDRNTYTLDHAKRKKLKEVLSR